MAWRAGATLGAAQPLVKTERGDHGGERDGVGADGRGEIPASNVHGAKDRGPTKTVEQVFDVGDGDLWHYCLGGGADNASSKQLVDLNFDQCRECRGVPVGPVVTRHSSLLQVKAKRKGIAEPNVPLVFREGFASKVCKHEA